MIKSHLKFLYFFYGSLVVFLHQARNLYLRPRRILRRRHHLEVKTCQKPEERGRERPKFGLGGRYQYPNELVSLGEMVIVAGFIVVWSLALVSRHVSAFSTSYETIQRSSSSSLVGVSGEKCTSPILSKVKGKKSLVVVLPQLGEFDSSEYCEFLVAAEQSLIKNDIEYCVAFTAARQFCDFTSLPPERLLLDLNGDIHRELGLHAGPGFDIPDSISDNVLRCTKR